MNKTLIIRADASSKIGAGHVMRCLALAQAFQDIGGDVCFVMAMDAGPLFDRLQKEGMEFRKVVAVPGGSDDVAQTIDIANEKKAAWLVLDGYHFNSEYQKAIKDAKLKLLVIDDNCEHDYYYADYILNQNIHAEKALYPHEKREAYTQLLLGTKYCLLRREFLKYKDFNRVIPQKAKNILVTMGGSDSNNVTCKVLEALMQINDSGLNVKIIVGGSNPHYEKIKQTADVLHSKTEIIINAQNMPELMMWADLAISAAGSTVWEMCYLKLPFIAIVIADNQRGITEYISRNIAPTIVFDKVGIDFTKKIYQSINDPSERQNIILPGIVDGKGSDRILCAMCIGTIKLRKVQESDCKLLWEWANDPVVRENSFSREKISWEDHCRWFKYKLSQDGSIIYIAEYQNMKIAYFRAEKVDDNVVISICIAPEFRGLGLATYLITLGTNELFKSNFSRKVVAFIKENNYASISAFLNAGYLDVKIKTDEKHGYRKLVCVNGEH